MVLQEICSQENVGRGDILDWGTVLQVKCLPQKYENLSLIPIAHILKEVSCSNPPAGEAESSGVHWPVL